MLYANWAGFSSPKEETETCWKISPANSNCGAIGHASIYFLLLFTSQTRRNRGVRHDNTLLYVRLNHICMTEVIKRSLLLRSGRQFFHMGEAAYIWCHWQIWMRSQSQPSQSSNFKYNLQLVRVRMAPFNDGWQPTGRMESYLYCWPTTAWTSRNASILGSGTSRMLF